MKIKNSLKSLKTRHRENRLVRRKGRVYIINKLNPRFKGTPGLSPWAALPPRLIGRRFR